MTTTSQQILVIEDDEKIADLLTRQLEAEQFQVHAEHRGQSGLNYAATHRPNLVILDLRLPDLHGYEVCRGLRKLYDRSLMPILMLTAMDRPVDQLRGYAYGADAYLVKPYDSSELLQTVSRLLTDSTLLR